MFEKKKKNSNINLHILKARKSTPKIMLFMFILPTLSYANRISNQQNILLFENVITHQPLESELVSPF